MSKPPTSNEAAIANAMANVAERMADIPHNLRARAVNAVAPALQARGEWLRLSTREAVAVAVLIAVKTELEAQAAAPDVAGRCPACGGTSLFLADGGYITCRRLDCPNPEAAHEAIDACADQNAAERSIRAAAQHAEAVARPDKPRHPNGETYSYTELKAGNWEFCDGCRMWTNGTIERPHQCTMTHIHGPVAAEQQ